VKIAKLSVIKMKYPTILSSLVAGTVETIGDGVTKLKVGDRVVSATQIYATGGEAKYGGLQRYVLGNELETTEIGDLPFPEAVAFGSVTPPAAIFGKSGLALDRPTNPQNPTPNGKKVLIWGGSSSMGALSISYAKQAGYTVISTSSPRNFSFLKTQGADYVFDHSDEHTIARIQELFPIDHWFDTISILTSISTIVKTLTPHGKDLVKADILTLLPPNMPGMPKLPEGITSHGLMFRHRAEENEDYVQWMLSKDGYKERGLKEGWIRGVPPHVVGGLEATQDGIDMLDKGVSAMKVVVEPWKNAL
jgi:NADPH:quinone reductase-like Zn-dependent oxidoreductase